MMIRCLWIWSIILLAACNAHQPSVKNRPRDVWVIRSVLDRQPRMLTIALDTNCYVAYDVANGTLEKVWKGGIILQGAAYSNQPNLQPVSWGKTYSDSLMNHWKVESNGNEDNFHVINKGYTLKDGRVNLHFAIVTSSHDTVNVDESPEYVMDDNGRPGLERKFCVSGAGHHIKVALTNGASNFLLNNGGATKMVSWFNPVSAVRPSVKSSDHTGRNYMEKSDCFTCHEVDKRNVGPSFQQIAARYKNDETVLGTLVAKIQQGGS